MANRPGGPLRQREQHHTGAELVQYAIDQKLIEFARGVLSFIERDQECGADTIGDIVNLACELCLAEISGEIDEDEEFRAIISQKGQ